MLLRGDIMKKLLIAVTIILVCIIFGFNVVNASDCCDTDEDLLNEIHIELLESKLKKNKANNGISTL